MTIDGNDPRGVLDKAANAVRGATETVQATSESIADAIEANRQPGGVLDQLSRLTRQAPIRSIAIAFVVGVIFAHRR